MNKKVSIILPTFNRADWIKKAINSIILQSHNNWELIVWDDGSTDQTEIVVKSFHDKRIFYYYEENHGVAYARNQAIKRSSGDYVAFIDSDDEWVPDKLTIQLRIFDLNPNINFVFSNFTNLNLLNNELDDWFALKKNGLRLLKTKSITDTIKFVEKGLPEILLISNFIATDSVIIKREIINKVGLFNVELKNSEDLELWWRIGLSYGIFAYSIEKLLLRNWLPFGLSRLGIVALQNEISCLDSCVHFTEMNKRYDLIPYINKSYRKKFGKLSHFYGKERNIRKFHYSYFKSLRYGFDMKLFYEYIIQNLTFLRFYLKLS